MHFFVLLPLKPCYLDDLDDKLGYHPSLTFACPHPLPAVTCLSWFLGPSLHLVHPWHSTSPLHHTIFHCASFSLVPHPPGPLSPTIAHLFPLCHLTILPLHATPWHLRCIVPHEAQMTHFHFYSRIINISCCCCIKSILYEWISLLPGVTVVMLYSDDRSILKNIPGLYMQIWVLSKWK